MPDIFLQWWARQLSLCGWPASVDPRKALSAEVSADRLTALGIDDRDEFAWRLWEASTDRQDPSLAGLGALELLALGAQVGWIEPALVSNWFTVIARCIVAANPTLGDWCRRLAVLNDADVDALAHDWRRQERQGRGPSWAVITRRLHRAEEVPGAALWGDDLWRARAVIAPPLAWPFSTDAAEREAHRRRLKREDDIDNRDGLLETFTWLTHQGDRYGWDMDVRRLQREGTDNAGEWLATLGEQRAYGEMLIDWVRRDEPMEWAAWDWLRIVDQAWTGYGAGWLSQQEAEGYAARAVDLIQARYADWESVARAYQRGRSLGEGRDLLADFSQEWQALLSASSSPWTIALKDVLDEQRRTPAREALRADNACAGDWVLAIASVREPDLAVRRHLFGDVTPARRRDAEHYLSHVLGLQPDEGVAGLARFWMPAQAHHLNQMAANARHAPKRVSPRERSAPLAYCAEFAATIVMAEKYAFYLVMAIDSGRYARDDIQDLVLSLVQALSRFYSDAIGMLSAWAAWVPLLDQESLSSETASNETISSEAVSSKTAPEESLLHDDLEWHRRDPGSRFHWVTPPPARTWKEPGRRPGLERFTALALAGPLNEAIWQWPQPASREERGALQGWLSQQYGFQGSRELLEFLDFLIDSGDRQDYEINYAPYTLNRKRLAAEIAILESGECAEEERVHLARLRRVRDNDCRCNEEDMAAWDIAQLVDLATTGRQLDWLDDAALERYLDTALTLARTHYASWDSYAKGLFSGFGFFMDDIPERESFLKAFREALHAWLTANPLLAGPWASLDFAGRADRHWTPLHVDVLVGEPRQMH